MNSRRESFSVIVRSALETLRLNIPDGNIIQQQRRAAHYEPISGLLDGQRGVTDFELYAIVGLDGHTIAYDLNLQCLPLPFGKLPLCLSQHLRLGSGVFGFLVLVDRQAVVVDQDAKQMPLGVIEADVEAADPVALE